MRSIVALRFAVCVGSVLAFGQGCAKGASGTVSGGENPNQIAAKWSNKTVTLKEVDEKVADQLFDLDQKRYRLRAQAVDQMLFEELVKAEAAKTGMTDTEWMRQQVDAKVTPPSDEQVQDVFNKAQGQMPPGSTLDTMRPQIVEYLTQQQKGELVRTLFDGLKKSANFEMVIAEPRKPKVEVAATGPSRGPDSAKVTIVEFSDFQCPYCSRAHDTVEEVMQAYAGKVRLVFRHFPLEFHAQAPKAAEASACAAEQGKFWEYHDVLFKNQSKLMPDDLKAAATAMGLDANKFNECFDSGRMAALVKTDTEAGKKAGVNGTPAFFINGQMLSGALPLDEFKKVIDAEMKAAN